MQKSINFAAFGVRPSSRATEEQLRELMGLCLAVQEMERRATVLLGNGK